MKTIDIYVGAHPMDLVTGVEPDLTLELADSETRVDRDGRLEDVIISGFDIVEKILDAWKEGVDEDVVRNWTPGGIANDEMVFASTFDGETSFAFWDEAEEDEYKLSDFPFAIMFTERLAEEEAAGPTPINEQVWAALPDDGAAIAFGMLASTLPGITPGDVRASLLLLAENGRALLVPGIGWYRI